MRRCVRILGVRAAWRSPCSAVSRLGLLVWGFSLQIDYEAAGMIGPELLRLVQLEFVRASGQADARERLDTAEHFFVRRGLVLRCVCIL